MCFPVNVIKFLRIPTPPKREQRIERVEKLNLDFE